MKFYKDSNGAVFAYEADGSQDGFIPATLIQITEAEADSIRFPAPTVAETQASALASIDAEAGAARARYITVAPGQEATYMLKAEQARAYKAANYPAAAIANYPMVEAEAKAINGEAPTAAQFQAAADGIITQADAWIAKAAQIERSRIAGKRAVTAAANGADVEASRAAAVAELGML